MRAGVLIVVLLAVGCYDEPGKIRGRSSVGSSSAEVASPQQRLVLDSRDALMTMSVLKRVRKRLEPLGVPSSAASIVGETVLVDVPGDRGAAAADALKMARLDVRAGEELLIRGESLASARAGGGGLLLAFAGTAKSALSRALDDKSELRVVVDGEDLASYRPEAYEGVTRDEGTLLVKVEEDRAKRLARELNGRALSHETKLEQKAIE